MNRDELKQRLIELLSEPIVIDSHGIPGYQIQITEKPANILVDRLIANGVTIRERGDSGEWRWKCRARRRRAYMRGVKDE